MTQVKVNTIGYFSSRVFLLTSAKMSPHANNPIKLIISEIKDWHIISMFNFFSRNIQNKTNQKNFKQQVLRKYLIGVSCRDY
ncbi:hypothetical protein EHP00_182 [Ecytonucleospora hepatopenaei]|uniref:Uncharacterized protein n=1 Tax=Ecytonucleospora hepatopenaei TaxID=646526 RepID=A0A1W0E6C9_9MICR|nr:hypothetical protein EHP00_182 [Ecytonucleospora hepatopenaei]